MSEKIVLPDRTTKEVILPKSKATLTVYASILAKDLDGISFSGSEKSVENGITILSRLIKSWNIFASEKDEAPVEINSKSIGELPADDITFLLNQVEGFAKEEKKN